MVKTNQFQLEVDGSKEWVMYRIEIIPAIVERRKREENKDEKKDEKKVENEDEKKDEKNKVRKIIPHPRKGDKSIDIERGSPLSRRILKQLIHNEKLFFSHDGSSTAYAPDLLFEGDSKDFQVQVDRDCDPDETDAHLSRNKSWFLVRFSHPCMIPTNKIEEFESMRRAIDIFFKHAMMEVGLKAFGRSPRVFYLPVSEQQNVIRTKLLGNMLRNVSIW